MTMKMMRSTSTTSTNGVTLMSDLMLPLPPTCMTLLVSGGLLGLRNQTNVVEANLAAGLEHVEHVAVHDQAVALDGHFAVGGLLVDVLERRFDLILADDVRPEVD